MRQKQQQQKEKKAITKTEKDSQQFYRTALAMPHRTKALT